MNVTEHKVNGISVFEVNETGVIIDDAGDFLDLIANLSAKKVIIKEENINKDFFDLKTGFAGEILQKVSNYNIYFGIIGNFENVRSKSLRDFIYESNNTKQVVFKKDADEILEIFCR